MSFYVGKGDIANRVLGEEKVSLERCPRFRSVLIKEVSSFQECPY